MTIFKYTHIIPILKTKQNISNDKQSLVHSNLDHFPLPTPVALPRFINELLFKSGIFKSLLCMTS